MVSVAEPAVRAADRGTQAVQLPGGWAGDLAWCGGAPWLAWASVVDPEPPLLAPANWDRPLRREAPLQPGVAPDDWRRAGGRARFVVSVARLEGGRPVNERRLTQPAHAVDGPALAALPGHVQPAVAWVERRGAGHALLAWIDGATEVVAENRGAMLGARIAAGAHEVGSGGTLCVAWQQWPARGAPQVVVSRRAGGGWSAPEAISPEGRAAWAPALAAGPDGELWCAWDAWDGTAYEVYAAHAPAGGRWSAPVHVSAPTRSGYGRFYHLAPDIAARAGEAWVAWNRSTRWGEVSHAFNRHRSLHAAVLDVDGGEVRAVPAPGRPVLGEPGRLPVPSVAFVHSTDEEYLNPQAPRIRLDGRGRPVVFYRYFRSAEFKDFGWTVCAVAHTGDDWTAPQQQSTDTGMPDAPYGVAPAVDPSGDMDVWDGRWLLAYHAADYAITAERQPSKPLRDHRLVVEEATVQSLAPDTQVGLHYLLPFEHPRTGAPAAVTARERDAEPREREIEVGGTRYQLLFGDLHRHSIYSKCMSANDGDPLDHWRWVTDVARLDFYALTEHLEYMSFLEWRRIEDLAESLAASGVLALGGFELAIPPGHTNFFYADQRVGYDLRVACLTSATLAEVWPKLDAWLPPETVVAIRHHQGHRGDVLAPTYAARYEPLAEIIQSRGEYPDWVQSLWRQGFRTGVAGATDHSRAAPIVQGLTGLWVPAGERTRAGVLAGLRARRTFATNGAKLAVFISAEGTNGGTAGMGEDGRVAGTPRLTVQVTGTRTIETVAFYRGSTLLHVAAGPPEMGSGAREATVTYDDRDAPPGEHAYWVRVTQDRERSGVRPHQGVAYTSPIWLTIEK